MCQGNRTSLDSTTMPSDHRGAWWRSPETLIAALAAVAGALAALALLNRKPQSSVRPPTVGDALDHRPIAGDFELSGVAHVPNSSQILVLDDDTTTEIFLVEVGPDTAQTGA